MKAVGIIGIGLVGHALADRFVAAGIQPVGLDINAAAVQRFKERGLPCASSIRQLCEQTDVLVLAVFDTDDVAGIVHQLVAQSGVRQPDGLIDCSTGDPERIEALSATARRAGLRYVEAPLSGSSEQIAKGEAVMIMGGYADDLAHLQPVLEIISPTRFEVGGPGMAARAKLATNLVLGLNRAVLAEGMMFAEGLGLSRERFLELVMATPARSEAARVKGPRMVHQQFDPPQSRIRQHLKDVQLMLVASAENGQRLPFSEVHAALMEAAVRSGDGELDNAAIIRQIARERLPR
jgi:3-hydroxyisobutyrate dehydrogenase-like beta-hydroxyacid dehydrogenase